MFITGCIEIVGVYFKNRIYYKTGDISDKLAVASNHTPGRVLWLLQVSDTKSRRGEYSRATASLAGTEPAYSTILKISYTRFMSECNWNFRNTFSSVK